MHRSGSLGIMMLLAAAATGAAAVALFGCTGFPGVGLGPGGFNQAPRPVITVDRTLGIVPFAVQFNSDRSADDGLIVSRLWDFGDGTTTSEIAPRHIFRDTGVFTVRLTVTDEQGLSASTTVTITATNAPVAVIEVDRTTAETAPATFNFDASRSFDPDGDVVAYEWDFDDGSREFEPIVSHRFTQPGAYVVTLTVTDDRGITGQATQVIAVGIATPAVEILMPDGSVKQIIMTTQSSLWMRATFAVDENASYFLRAGIDGDRDVCDAQAFVYNTGTGGEILRTVGHVDRVRAAELLPDGQHVVTAGEDGRVLVVEIATGDIVAQILDDSAINAMRVVPGGQRVAYGTADGRVVLASLFPSEVLRTFVSHAAAVLSIDVSPTGGRIMSGGADNRAIIWDAQTGLIQRDLAHPGAVSAVAFSPTDLDRAATGTRNGVLRFWDIEGGDLAATLTGHVGAINAAAFSPSGLLFASAGADNTVRIWSDLGQFIRSIPAHDDDVLALAFSPDGTRLATGGLDRVAIVWDLESSLPISTVQPCDSPVTSVAFSPDGSAVAAGVGARTAIQLDTDPPNGNDLNFTFPIALDLREVPLRTDEPNRFFLWAEIETTVTAPVRHYADAEFVIVQPFPTVFDPATLPEALGEGDSFDVVLGGGVARQIVNLGAVSAGDRIIVEPLTIPGYIPTTDVRRDYSLMFLDPDGEIVAWYTQKLDFLGDPVVGSGFTGSSLLTAPEDLSDLYVVMDGGVSARFRFIRNYRESPSPAQQRVLVNFAGSPAIRVGAHPLVIPAPFDITYLQTIGQFWTDMQIDEFKDAVIARLENVFAGYDVQFFRDDDPVQPAAPYIVMHVAGTSSRVNGVDNAIFGVADHADPQNPVLSGNAIVFANSIWVRRMEFVSPGATIQERFGDWVGITAAHLVGQLVGLRPTEPALSPDDVMRDDAMTQGGSVLRMFEVSPASTPAQVLSLPSIGVQNAPKYLEQIVGPTP